MKTLFSFYKVGYRKLLYLERKYRKEKLTLITCFEKVFNKHTYRHTHTRMHI